MRGSSKNSMHAHQSDDYYHHHMTMRRRRQMERGEFNTSVHTFLGRKYCRIFPSKKTLIYKFLRKDILNEHNKNSAGESSKKPIDRLMHFKN